MKKLILILALVAISHSIVFSQGCLPNGITFANQGQIDNFQANYPGCAEILGNVNIHDETQPQTITNLQGLNVITSIGGDLTIQWDGLLTSLSGLDNLTSIGGHLYILNCNALTSLTGLENLTSIGGGLRIYNCYYVSSLSGLESLTTIGNSLEISNASDLNNMSGLGNLVSIGTHLLLSNNSVLTSLAGLEGLTSIPGSFQLDYNVLTNLSGLSNLTYIGDYLGIYNSNALTNLTGLENLQSIGGSFRCKYNSLTNLTGLENLTSIGGDLQIYWNDSLTSLTGLENLTTIGGELGISHNDTLMSLTGIENIQANSIEDLTIYDNYLLSECDVQSVCEYLSAPNGEIDISDNEPGCNSPEEVILACETAIDENKTGELIFFPNPASTSISLTTPQGEPIEETIIYNHLGQKEQVAEPVNNTVDVSVLKAGIYYLEVVTKEWVGRNKFIKQ